MSYSKCYINIKSKFIVIKLVLISIVLQSVSPTATKTDGK
jgi:hypothetical protein